MSKESKKLSELLGDDLNKIDKDRIMSRVEQTYGMRIAELKDKISNREYINKIHNEDFVKFKSGSTQLLMEREREIAELNMGIRKLNDDCCRLKVKLEQHINNSGVGIGEINL